MPMIIRLLIALVVFGFMLVPATCYVETIRGKRGYVASKVLEAVIIAWAIATAIVMFMCIFTL